MKGILTRDHISSIEKEVLHPMYKMQGAISFSFGTKNPMAIMKISPKGLIFIKGTDDTGFEHIHQRHSGSSGIDFWNEFRDNKGQVTEKKDVLGRKKLRLDNPSNFHPHSIPIIDYLSVADQVYCSENINDKNNKKKDLFDVYDGTAKGINGNEIKYRLITYKDSKIVHTLIPLTKKFNKQEKIIVHFARQDPTSIIRLIENDIQVEIPYKDEFQIIRYIVIVRNDRQDKSKEKWYIQINSPNGTPIATEHYGKRDKDCDISSEKYLWRIEKMNLKPLDKDKIEDLIGNIGKRIEK